MKKFHSILALLFCAVFAFTIPSCTTAAPDPGTDISVTIQDFTNTIVADVKEASVEVYCYSFNDCPDALSVTNTITIIERPADNFLPLPVINNDIPDLVGRQAKHLIVTTINWRISKNRCSNIPLNDQTLSAHKLLHKKPGNISDTDKNLPPELFS